MRQSKNLPRYKYMIVYRQRETAADTGELTKRTVIRQATVVGADMILQSATEDARPLVAIVDDNGRTIFAIHYGDMESVEVVETLSPAACEPVRDPVPLRGRSL